MFALVATAIITHNILIDPHTDLWYKEMSSEKFLFNIYTNDNISDCKWYTFNAKIT